MPASIVINETRILREIWLNPGVSRIGIARSLRLSKAAVTNIVGGFLDEGLIVPAKTPDITNTNGRRPTGIYLNTAAGCIIGIEVETDRWYAAALDLRGARLDTLPAVPISPETRLTEAVDTALTAAVNRQRAAGRIVLGAGIGLSGLVNPHRGIILSSNPLGVESPLHLTAPLRDKFGFPVVIENDANCCCWKTMIEHGSNRDRNFIALLGELRRTRLHPADGYSELSGIGVGLGIVINDSVVYGNGFSAGEFQSIFKTPLNTNPSQFGIQLDQLPSLRHDEKLWRDLMTELSRNLALLVNTLNTTSIIIFGDFARRAEPLVSILTEEIQNNWPYTSHVSCKVKVDDDCTHSAASGAAALLLHRFFSRPDAWEAADTELPAGIDLLREAISLGRAADGAGRNHLNRFNRMEQT